MTARKLKWLICTDLDASLLDGSYRWSGAESALRAIETAGIPLILNSSKTLAEMRFFATALDAKAPVLAENGTVLAFPEGLNFGSATGRTLERPRRQVSRSFLQVRRLSSRDCETAADRPRNEDS